MQESVSFGTWLRQRRRALDLTQKAFADQVGCAEITVRRMEADAYKPSSELAFVLFEKLGIPEPERPQWVRFARELGEYPNNLSIPSTSREQKNNLPFPLTSFIGREKDIESIQQSLAQHRIVTLIGSGGIGKTRLSQHVARQAIQNYADGVWFVELAELSDPSLIPGEISKALGIVELPNQKISDGLVEFLKSHPQILLILDNCEHLIESCADLSNMLLKKCSKLQILATSRQALGLSNEAVWFVNGLSMPNFLKETQPIENQVFNAELLSEQSEAIRLFIERARLIQPNFRLTARNILAIGQICQSLDGMPLAIELAAARMNVLSVEEIATRLSQRFQLLRTKNHDVEERHQTLKAVLEWSYKLLSVDERLLFHRLSVFRGGFTLDAAKAVGGQPTEDSTILDLLTSLVEKSMIVVETRENLVTRYRMLETVRLYGQERLIEAGEEESIRRRHAVFFTLVAEKADLHLRGPLQVTWLESLELDHDNLRTALEWTSNEDPITGLHLVSSLWWFWIIRSYFAEGKEWMERFLSPERVLVVNVSNVKAYVRYAYLMSYLLDNQQLYRIAEESLKRARLIEDLEDIATSLLLMAGDPYYTGDVQKSSSLLKESLAIFRQDGNQWGSATALRALAELVEVRFHNHDEARELLLESMTLFQEIGELRGISGVLFLLGEIERRLGHWNSASTHYQACLTYRHKLKDRYGMAIVLWKMGTLAELQNEFTQAIKLREESLQLFHAINQQDMVAKVKGQLAYLAFLVDQQGKASELAHETLKMAKDMNDQSVSLNALMTLGEVALSMGDVVAAFQHFRRSLEIIRDSSLPPSMSIYILEALARLAISQNKVERAVSLLSAAEAMRNKLDMVLIPKIRESRDASIKQAHEYLIPEALQTAWQNGHVLAQQGWEHVIAYAIGM